MQTIPLAAGDLDDPRSAASLRVLLPAAAGGAAPSYTIKTSDISGTLTAVPDAGAPLRQVVSWRDAANPGASMDVLAVTLDPSRPRLDVSWRTTALLRRPDVAALARAVVQRAVLVVAGAGGARPQEIRFKPADPVDVEVGASPSPAALPPVPPGVDVVAARPLPGGWRMTARQEWDAAADHSPDAASNVLDFDRPESPDAPHCQFTVRFAPGWKSAQGDWPARRQAARDAQASADADLAKAEEDLTRAKFTRTLAVSPVEKELADAEALKLKSDDDLRLEFTSRREVALHIEHTRETLAATQARMDAVVNGIVSKRDDAAHAAKLRAAESGAYDESRAVDVAVELPGGLPVVTVRLTEAPPAGAGPAH